VAADLTVKPRRWRGGRTRVDTTQAASPGWLRGYLRALGPGLVTGASDDDPSGIATYAQAGSSFGFSFLWTAVLTFPLMAAVQEICDRTALATGKGLGELATERLGGKSRSVVIGLVGLLIVANALNISTDFVEWALPIQEEHFSGVKSDSLMLTCEEDPTDPARLGHLSVLSSSEQKKELLCQLSQIVNGRIQSLHA